MALNALKCDHLALLALKGLMTNNFLRIKPKHLMPTHMFSTIQLKANKPERRKQQ